MRKLIPAFVVLVAVMFLFVRCDSSSKESDIEKAANDMETAAKKMAKAGKEMGEKMGGSVGEMAEAMKMMGKALGEGASVEPVNFRELKKLLPER